MTADEITTECPAITIAGVRAAAAYGAALAREDLLPPAAAVMTFRLGQCLPVSEVCGLC
jgi:hypothetical protein